MRRATSRLPIWKVTRRIPNRMFRLKNRKAAQRPAEGGSAVEEILLDGGTAVGGFFVKDSTDAGLDLEQELQKDPDLSIRTDGTPMVLIYHTHTTECYLPAFTGRVYETDVSRTLDETQNVVAVGEKGWPKRFVRAEIGVIHDKTVHDDPVYTGAYDRSWETIQKTWNNIRLL